MWVSKLTVFLVITIFFMIVAYNPASAREIIVGSSGSDADFRSIQEAVNNSSSGDEILVYPGFYNESVDIGVQNISILSESENPEDTTVRAFNVSANNITVNGFSVREDLTLKSLLSEPGYTKTENCTVRNNRFLGQGVYATNSYNSTIVKNSFLGKDSGISIDGYYSTISDNTVVDGSISMSVDSGNNILINNTLLKGSIGFGGGSGNKIIGNNISSTEESCGIAFSESSSNIIDNNFITNASYGISMPFFSDSDITNNTIISNTVGIFIAHYSSGSLIKNNTISNNGIGISLDDFALVTDNRIELNKECGIYFDHSEEHEGSSSDSRIHNNLFNNTVNLFNSSRTENLESENPRYTPGSAVWNITKTPGTSITGGPYLGGNFWAKPDGTGFSQRCNDWDGDGIGDSIYTINTYDVDYLPLVSMSKTRQQVFPVANFSTNVSNGYVPLSVLFTDFSQNETSRVWDFDNDGVTDSIDKNPVHVYPVPGIYTVNLTVSNENGTSSRLYPVTASNRPQYTLTEYQITTNNSNQTMPSIYGDKIVFLDDRSGWNNIYMYDLSTSKEAQITTSESKKEYPAIFEDKIVWQEYSNNTNTRDKSDIHMYNLSTSKEIQVTNSGGARNPVIYGDKIAYIYTLNGITNICFYDLSTSSEIQITNNGSAKNPAIYKDRIVWQDSRNRWETYDIYMYDLFTKKETQITTNQSTKDLAIYGDKIVWTDYRNGYSDIYMYNLSTSKETRITINGSAYDPTIYEDRIVWQDRNDREYLNADIYMYNISTHTETQITSNKSRQSSPAIYGDRIVWVDSHNEYTNVFPYANADIYMCTVSGIKPSLKTPVADFFANITSGNAPLKVLFTDNSTGSPNFWYWDFGDGIKSKHALNATHTFTEKGEYDVSLTVTNENGSNTKITPKYITVS